MELPTLEQVNAFIVAALSITTVLATALKNAAQLFDEMAARTETKRDDAIAAKLLSWTTRLANAADWLGDRLPVITTRKLKQ